MLLCKCTNVVSEVHQGYKVETMPKGLNIKSVAANVGKEGIWRRNLKFCNENSHLVVALIDLIQSVEAFDKA
ncbi:hypothetical protein VNO77_25562 [Canavalia gladiata]|uniref:Uncharacterized protein n=1 Tax=Canavalia gladiata TaxID=3824 RepID=A0AAN9QB13_CANGL